MPNVEWACGNGCVRMCVINVACDTMLFSPDICKARMCKCEIAVSVCAHNDTGALAITGTCAFAMSVAKA